MEKSNVNRLSGVKLTSMASKSVAMAQEGRTPCDCGIDRCRMPKAYWETPDVCTYICLSIVQKEELTTIVAFLMKNV